MLFYISFCKVPEDIIRDKETGKKKRGSEQERFRRRFRVEDVQMTEETWKFPSILPLVDFRAAFEATFIGYSTTTQVNVKCQSFYFHSRAW